MNGSPLVFITGASSGLGQALALRFPWRRLSAGPGRAPERRGRTLGRGAGIDAGRFAVYTADVRDVAATVAAGKACIAAQGVPDVVIANAGISVGIDTADPADLEVMRATLETNVLGMARPSIRSSRRCRSAVPDGWSASPASPASAACPGTAPTAPARRR
jgi:NAD(P)-dependent dehydrogenase (short-subunit alcohol dehydrogenase family)